MSEGGGWGRIGVTVCQRVQCRCRELRNFINCEPPPSPRILISLLTPNYIPNINFRNLPISTAPQCLVACWTRYKFSRILLHYTGCSKSRHTEITLAFQGNTTLLTTHGQQKVTVTVAGANLIAVLPTVANKKLKASKNDDSSVLHHVGKTFRAADSIFPQ